ncbi:MAG TPA: aspartyl protease family protein [Gemmatimonadaceae bacterium]|nr:aspartyl protease family protein [Gemmatimonadaceae bacterium]
MRRIGISAAKSRQLLLLDYVGVRNWIIFAFSGLLLGASEEAAAQWQREARFISHDDSLLASGGGGYAPTRTRTEPVETAPVTAKAETGPEFDAVKYWDAVADLDLATLRNNATGGAQSVFARGMSLLADGDAEGAERAFIEGSEQPTDVNVGIASQIMLAMTLLYEHKWAELRSFAFSPHLSPPDKEIVRGYQQWGFAFANVEPQRVSMAADSAILRLHESAIGTPTIRVRVNGKEYDFWLDTGSSITVLNSDVAEEVGAAILSSENFAVRTFGGSAPVKAAFVRRIEIGPLLLENTPAVVVDAGHMALQPAPDRPPGRRMRIDGIIGWDTIRQLDLLLDYRSGLVAIRRPQRSAYSAHNLTWMGKPFVEVRSKRGETLHFTLDTGAQGSFLNALALEKTGATTTLADNTVFGIAGTGRRADKVVRSLPLDVGAKSVRMEGVLVYGPSYSGLINCDGILGVDIARFGTIRIDATNGIFAVGLNPLRELD